MLFDIVKLGRPRTWIFIILAFIMGWVTSGESFSTIIIIYGIIIYILWIASTNIINAYTDVDEDKINLPHRAELVERIGSKGVLYASLFLYAITILLSYLLMPFLFFIIYLVAVFDSFFYSMPPLRFKANPYASLIAFSGAIFFPFVGAWSLSGNLSNLWSIAFFLTYWFLTYGTIKNIPDYTGDKVVGLKTSATIFRERRTAIKFSFAFLITPYILLILLLLFNYLNIKFLSLLIGLPFISLIMYKALNLQEFGKLEKIHTWGFFYAVSFLSLFLFLLYPTINSIILILFLFIVLLSINITKFDSR